MVWTKKRKKYSKPRRAHDLKRMEEESGLIKKYGLKNKKEIWKADAAIERIRGKAKKLITSSTDEQKKFLDKVNKIGLRAEKIADVLSLDKEDWLKRRLQSILVQKKLVKPRQARQLIAHKHVLVDYNIVNIPSYIVKTEEESKIKIKLKTRKVKADEGRRNGKEE